MLILLFSMILFWFGRLWLFYTCVVDRFEDPASCWFFCRFRWLAERASMWDFWWILWICVHINSPSPGFAAWNFPDGPCAQVKGVPPFRRLLNIVTGCRASTSLEMVIELGLTIPKSLIGVTIFQVSEFLQSIQPGFGPRKCGIKPPKLQCW